MRKKRNVLVNGKSIDHIKDVDTLMLQYQLLADAIDAENDRHYTEVEKLWHDKCTIVARMEELSNEKKK